MNMEQQSQWMPKLPKRMATVMALCAFSTIALAGCRADEQDRIMTFEPGVYQGKKDAALNQTTLDTLRGRASMQGSP